MKTKSNELIELGFIQDENFPSLFTFKESPLEFLLQDGVLIAGQDLAGDEEMHQVFFKIESFNKVCGFLSSITVEDYKKDIFEPNLN